MADSCMIVNNYWRHLFILLIIMFFVTLEFSFEAFHLPPLVVMKIKWKQTHFAIFLLFQIHSFAINMRYKNNLQKRFCCLKLLYFNVFGSRHSEGGCIPSLLILCSWRKTLSCYLGRGYWERGFDLGIWKDRRVTVSFAWFLQLFWVHGLRFYSLRYLSGEHGKNFR